MVILTSIRDSTFTLLQLLLDLEHVGFHIDVCFDEELVVSITRSTVDAMFLDSCL